MVTPPLPPNEARRLAALHGLAILDTPSEERFDRITRLSKRLFNVPATMISLIDANRQWFKSSIGVPSQEMPRDISFCGHAILGDDLMVVPDMLRDHRFSDNPLVTGETKVRFYAGCPLSTLDGSNV